MSTSETASPSWRLGPAARFLVYGLIGISVECLFSSVMDLATGSGDLRLRGYSYLWMHPIWGGSVLLGERLALVMRRHGLGVVTRGFVYMLVCFALEYVAGAVLVALIGRCPWDYTVSPWNVHGLIRLDYAPFWALCGLAGESVCQLVRRVRIHAVEVHPVHPVSPPSRTS